MFELPDGDLVFTGEKYDGPTLGDAYIEQFDPGGTLRWSQPLAYPYFQRGEHLIRTLDNGFLLVGNSQDLQSGGDKDVFIVRTDSLGDTLWTRQYGGSGNDEGFSAVSLPNGGFAVAGGKRNLSGTESDYYLLRLNAGGDTLWTRTYSRNAQEVCTGIATRPGGGFILCGYTVSNPQLQVVEEWVVITDSVGDTLHTRIVGEAAVTGESQQVFGLPNGDFVTVSKKQLIRMDSLGNPVWNRNYSNYALSDFDLTADGGFILTGSFNHPPFGNDLVLLKTDGQGNVFSNVISGRIFRDNAQNCQFDPGDSALVNQLIRVQPGGWFATTDSNGFYEVQVDTGNITLEALPPNGYWNPDCPSTGIQTVYFPVPYDTADGVDFTFEPVVQCPLMRVNVGTPWLRPCFNTPYLVNWCNEGTAPADSVFITVELDSFLVVDSSQIPFRTPQTGNTYVFDIGTVPPGGCGSFFLYTTLSCSAVLGQAHCVKAVIQPDTLCLPLDPQWEGASVAVEVDCEAPDSVKFTVSNVGANAMSGPGGLMVLEDDILSIQGNFTLGAGLDTVIRVPANGSTWTLIADQRPAHPGNSRPILTIEGCGRDTAGDFSRGFLTRFPTDDADPWIDILCRQNTAAYDPNIKTAQPEGQGIEHKILYDHDLEYTIQFQNTGTDTAFTVVIRDTLPVELDLTILQLGVASHPYTFRIYGRRIAQWTFPQILLPDSNVNVAGSKGFLTFRIVQQQVNEPGTEIENTAGIYFDFNAPVVTPPAFHLVTEEEDLWVMATLDPSPSLQIALQVYPNPFNRTATFDLGEKYREVVFEVWNMQGQQIRRERFANCQAFSMERKELVAGMYLFRITSSAGTRSSGRLLIR